MLAGGGELSRDPNICASCSSLADGMLDQLVQAAVQQIAAEQEKANAEAAIDFDDKTKSPRDLSSARTSV